MKTIIQALMIVFFLDSLIFLTQVSILNINPAGTNFFEYEGSDISKFDISNGEYVLNQDVSQDFPEVGNPVAVSLGSNIFTDVFSTLKNWLLKIPGAKYVLLAVNAVPTYIKYFGFPAEIQFAIGFIWHALSFVLVLMFIKQ